jgi:predicted nucleotidyltransferase component of viral defense system
MSTPNLVASIKQRLLNLSRQRNEDFQLVLTHYVIERFLCRLSQSAYSQRFVLKGAMLFQLWGRQPYRPTRDLDLLGFGDASVEYLMEAFKEICATPVEPDGLRFDSSSVCIMEIREPQEYPGQRIQIIVHLGKAKVSLQVDIGFGDVVVPSIQNVNYPTMLGMRPPTVRAYPKETFVAEKLESIVQLGMANSRMKDFYDIWSLTRNFEFEGQRLVKAVRVTFHRRQTELPQDIPIALTPEFGHQPEKNAMWAAFLRRNGLEATNEIFPEVIQALERFLVPVLSAASSGNTFKSHWPIGGPWIKIR